jgi:hypothetical protein
LSTAICPPFVQFVRFAICPLLVFRMMQDVLRPFLEKWHGQYRHWWENESNKGLPPFLRQAEFPSHEDFLRDWANLRWLMRRAQKRLMEVYKLVDIT